MKRSIILTTILILIFINCGWLQAIPADFNNNGVIDVNDLNLFVSAWLSDNTPTANWNSDCDISDPNDGVVNFIDWSVLSANWLWEAIYTPDPNEFSDIPAGTFEMGDHNDSLGAGLPIHTVTLDSFYMGKYEITNQQYCDYLNSAYPAQIKVDGGVVYASDDTSNNYPYCNTHDYDADSLINYSGGVFSVNIKDGTTDMSNHPIDRR